MLAWHGGFTAAPCASDVKDEAVEDQTELAKMREIDPQSERLTGALRHLAASSPQSAPPEVAAGLLGEFRRHHAQRRRRRTIGILAVAACLVLAAYWSSRPLLQRHSSQENFARAVTHSDQGTSSPAAPIVATVPKQPQRAVGRPHPPKPLSTQENRAFLALPAYDPTVPMEDLQVVRVQLPASALWKMGAPMLADAGERRMTADFVVGQDGTAYAVRLVQ